MSDPVVSSARNGKAMALEDNNLTLTEVIAEVRRQGAIIKHLEDQHDSLLARLAEVEALHKNKKSEFAAVTDIGNTSFVQLH